MSFQPKEGESMKSLMIKTFLTFFSCISFSYADLCHTINSGTNLVNLSYDGKNWTCSTGTKEYTPRIIMPMTIEVMQQLSESQKRWSEIRCEIGLSSELSLPISTSTNIPFGKVSSVINVIQVFKISNCDYAN